MEGALEVRASINGRRGIDCRAKNTRCQRSSTWCRNCSTGGGGMWFYERNDKRRWSNYLLAVTAAPLFRRISPNQNRALNSRSQNLLPVTSRADGTHQPLTGIKAPCTVNAPRGGDTFPAKRTKFEAERPPLQHKNAPDMPGTSSSVACGQRPPPPTHTHSYLSALCTYHWRETITRGPLMAKKDAPLGQASKRALRRKSNGKCNYASTYVMYLQSRWTKRRPPRNTLLCVMVKSEPRGTNTSVVNLLCAAVVRVRGAGWSAYLFLFVMALGGGGRPGPKIFSTIRHGHVPNAPQRTVISYPHTQSGQLRL